MKHKIIGKLFLNGEHYGFRIISEENEIIDCDNRSISMLDDYGLLENSRYTGKDGNVESLPVINLEITKTKHQKAKEYIRKLELLDSDLKLRLQFLPYDRVRLVEVRSEKPLKSFTIPSFITDFNNTIMSMNILASIEHLKVDNDKNTFINVSYLCQCMNEPALKVTFSHPERILNAEGLFRACSSTCSIELPNFKASNIVKTSSMFNGCNLLKEIDLSQMNLSNVLYMDSMFSGCIKLESIKFSNSYTDNLNKVRFIFSGCKSLKKLDLSHFKTSKVTSMERMFEDCRRLISLDLSSFDTSNVEDMEYMFHNCASLERINLSSFDTSKVKKMTGMFSGCKNLEEINISHFKSNRLIDLAFMFSGCKIRKLDLNWLDFNNYYDLSFMLDNSSYLEELSIRNIPIETLNRLNLSSHLMLEYLDIRNLRIKSTFKSEYSELNKFSIIRKILKDTHIQEIILPKGISTEEKQMDAKIKSSAESIRKRVVFI